MGSGECVKRGGKGWGVSVWCVAKQSEGVSEKRRSLEICKRVYTFLSLFLCVFLL